ncbi:MAG: alpha/beta hydrolase [Rhodocyclaceae bacterium]|nr:alpha/beta hydrolase [Rhodocyclaceae bacterium]
MELRDELKEAKSRLGRIAGTVASPACQRCPTVLVALGADGKTVHTYRVLERPGAFEMVTFGDSRLVFGFNDLNSDFQFQPNEPGAWVQIPEEFSSGKRVDGIDLVLTHDAPSTAPIFGNLFDLRGMTLGMIDVQLGTVADLSDARFDADFAELGMWQPLRFMKEAYAGIYFLAPFAPEKIPVLFVHGINGSPRDFAAIIASMDRRRFQPWVIYYPSGIKIDALGDGMSGMLTELRHRYGFEQLILVAHSMGGLVTRSYLDGCASSKNCSYLRSFISISSPFGGHKAAQSGVDYAPVVLPVWRSMAPDSKFLRQLFSQPLPHNLPHHLIFGFRNAGVLDSTSGDGTIALSSQLRKEVQRQAVTQRGFDEGHVSILGADGVIEYVNELLTQASFIASNQ